MARLAVKAEKIRKRNIILVFLFHQKEKLLFFHTTLYLTEHTIYLHLPFKEKVPNGSNVEKY